MRRGEKIEGRGNQEKVKKNNRKRDVTEVIFERKCGYKGKAKRKEENMSEK